MLLCAKILGRRTTWCAKVVSCALLLLAACQPADNSGTQIADAQLAAACRPSNQYCALQMVEPGSGQSLAGRWRIDGTSIRAEQPLAFTLELDKTVVIEQATATVRGVTMNMGVLPLFVDRIDGNHLYGRLLLPACSSNNMAWRAEFRITTAEGNVVLSHEFYADN